MDNQQQRLEELTQKLERLMIRQSQFNDEIELLRQAILQFRNQPLYKASPLSQKTTEPARVENNPIQKEEAKQEVVKAPEKQAKASPPPVVLPEKKPSRRKTDFESFIGSNLINKIGIILVIMGVSIGTKLAIDQGLINPLTRIVLGYIAGLVLLGFSVRLKKNYHAFSAVLLSGSMAVFYFITYAAYDFYNLMPRGGAFALMVFFTAFTVFAAIRYNQQIIAHIALVGSYAIPFLLSTGSNDTPFLFSYMAILNTGILLIAFKKYWKPLYFSAFFITWLIFFIWYVADYETSEHFKQGILFLTIFFIIFYLLLLPYKIISKEKFNVSDVILLLSNSFIFYGLTYLMLSDLESGEGYLGLMTLGNALIHFIVSLFVFRFKLADRGLFYLVSGLVLVFLTMAIPVQLDGRWVTLLWAAEAALLFWIGRTKQMPIYERIGFVVLIIAFFSILHDWGMEIDDGNIRSNILLNTDFLTTLLVAGGFTFVALLNRKSKYITTSIEKNRWRSTIGVVLPILTIVVLYLGCMMEIASYWNEKILLSERSILVNGDFERTISDTDLSTFKTIWILNYSILFVSLLSLLNQFRIKNNILASSVLWAKAILILLVMVVGNVAFAELQESYLEGSEYYIRSSYHIAIRYITYAFVALMFRVAYQTIKQLQLKAVGIALEAIGFLTLLVICSAEFKFLQNLLGSGSGLKIGLSIVWAVFATIVIIIGIWKKKKYLRISSLILLSVTLIKVIAYDMVTYPKTTRFIVPLIIGVVFLLVSFLYNKYKHVIFNEEDK